MLQRDPVWQAPPLETKADCGKRPATGKRKWLTGLVCWLWLLSPLTAVVLADDAVGETQEVAQPEQSDAKPADEGNLTQSIPFGHDRKVEQALLRAKSLLAEKNWVELTDVLQEILDESPGSLVRTAQETYHRAASEVHHLLRQAGRQTLDQYDRRVNQRAAAKLQQALAEQDILALQRIAEQYRYTAAGEQSLEQLGLYHLQTGNRLSAAQVWRDLIRRHPEPEALLRRRPELAARYLFALQSFPEQIEQFWEEHGDLLATLTLSDGTQLSRPQVEPVVQQESEAALELPLASVPVWQHMFEHAPVPEAEVQAGIHDLAEHGLHPLPTWHGCRANGLWIVSQPQGLTALDAESGRQKWFRPHEWNSARSYGRQSPSEDPLERRLMRLELLMRMYAEATFNHLTTDGQRLFQVVPTHPAGLFEMPLNNQEHAFPSQSLICMRATTGETVWTTQGGQFAPLFFTGPPVLDGQRLYSLAETRINQTLVLLALRPEDGEVEQVVDLSKPASGINEDFRRTNRAGLIIPSGELLLCATGAGALIAVDRLSLEFRWAYRFSREDLPKRNAAAHEGGTGQLGYQNWRGWRDAQLQLVPLPDQPQAQTALFVSPESERLHALDPQTGNVRWACAVPEGIKLIGTTGQTVYVLEKRHIRSLSLETGETLEMLSIPTPGGNGLLTGSKYVFPTTTGQLVTADLVRRSLNFETGTKMEAGSRTSPPATMLRWNQQVLMLTHAGVKCLQPLGKALATLPREPRGQFERESWIRLQRQQGNFLDAEGRLQEWLRSTTDDDSLLAALLDETVLEWAETQGYQQVPEAFRDQLLARDGDQSQQWWRIVVDQALSRQDWNAALEASLQLWAMPLEQERVISPDRLCSPRLDRWLQGRWLTALETLDADKQRELSETVLPPLMALVAERELKAAQVVDRVQLLPWGTKWRTQMEPTWQDEASYAKTELRLLAQLGNTTGDVREATQVRLLELYRNRRDAIRWYKELLASRTNRMADEADPLEAVLKQWEADHASQVETGLFPGWAVRVPVLSQKDRFSADIRFAPVPVEAERNTLPDRLNMALDWPGGQGVQFTNSQWSRPWVVRTPTTGRFLRTHLDLSRGWGLGQQLLVKMGSEVFGVSPISVEGERRARILWPQRGEKVDSLGDRSEIMLSFYEQKPAEWIGFPTPPRQFVDEYEHYVGSIGPVNCGYFCMQQKGMLVACDPATGTEFWRRHELPPLAECIGDEQRILIWGRDSLTGQLLRVADGHELGTVELPYPDESRRIVRGGFALYATGDGLQDQTSPDLEDDDAAEAKERSASDGTQFEWWNLLDQKLAWRLQRPAGTIPFAVDQEWFGLLQTDGQLELIELSTGRVLSQLRLELKGPVSRIGCSVGEKTLLLAVSGPMEDAQLRNAPQLHEGYRRMLVDGPLLCLNRQSGELLWMTELENDVFSLDQPADLPVFVLTSNRQPEPKDGGNSYEPAHSRIRIYDRRDGALLFSDEAGGPRWNFHVVYGDSEQQRITIKTQSVIFELDYAEPEADKQPQKP